MVAIATSPKCSPILSLLRISLLAWVSKVICTDLLQFPDPHIFFKKFISFLLLNIRLRVFRIIAHSRFWVFSPSQKAANHGSFLFLKASSSSFPVTHCQPFLRAHPLNKFVIRWGNTLKKDSNYADGAALHFQTLVPSTIKAKLRVFKEKKDFAQWNLNFLHISCLSFQWWRRLSLKK